LSYSTLRVVGAPPAPKKAPPPGKKHDDHGTPPPPAAPEKKGDDDHRTIDDTIRDDPWNDQATQWLTDSDSDDHASHNHHEGAEEEEETSPHDEEEGEELGQPEMEPYTITVVSVKQGLLSSDEPIIQEDGSAVLAFKGIPYAKPPVKNLRWKPPEPAEGWDGIRDASSYSALCVQIQSE